jgi:hypothetical protein
VLTAAVSLHADRPKHLRREDLPLALDPLVARANGEVPVRGRIEPAPAPPREAVSAVCVQALTIEALTLAPQSCSTTAEAFQVEIPRW